MKKFVCIFYFLITGCALDLDNSEFDYQNRATKSGSMHTYLCRTSLYFGGIKEIIPGVKINNRDAFYLGRDEQWQISTPPIPTKIEFVKPVGTGTLMTINLVGTQSPRYVLFTADESLLGQVGNDTYGQIHYEVKQVDAKTYYQYCKVKRMEYAIHKSI